MSTADRRADYGVDAPGLVRGFLAGGGVALLAAIVVAFAGRAWPPWHLVVAGVLFVPAIYLGGMGCFMLFWSKVTKVREREGLLDLIAWRGDEAVLDVGCGRGLLLVGAAHRVAAGHVVGIDIWQAADQSANVPEAALANAAIEGVRDRVEVRTADMRTLPFGERTFDVVVSHWAVHNLPANADRDRAIAEMVRVVRPGGTILLADIEHRDAYAQRLAALGLRDVRIVVDPRRDAMLNALSFGSFRPAVFVATA